MNHDDRDSSRPSEPALDAALARMEASGRSALWWRRIAIAVIVMAASAPLLAQALEPVPNTFTDGDVVSASAMNDNFTHLQNAITALESRATTIETGVGVAETRLVALEARPPLPACGNGQVAYRDGGSWECDDPTDLVDANQLLRTKVMWGILYHNAGASATHCAVEESSITGMTCTFSNGTITVNTPGWTTHYANDVVTANASWCQSCSNLGIRVDPLSNTQTVQLVLTGYNSGTVRANFVLIRR